MYNNFWLVRVEISSMIQSIYTPRIGVPEVACPTVPFIRTR